MGDGNGRKPARAFSANPKTQAPKSIIANTAPQQALTLVHQKLLVLHWPTSSRHFDKLTSKSRFVSSPAIIRDVGSQHESIRLVVTHCPLLPHISGLLSTLLYCSNPKGSPLANHNPPAFPTTATGPLRSATCNLCSCPFATIAEIRGHLTPCLARYPASFSINMLTIAKTIYIYLGVASITGISCGLLLHFVYSFLHSNLHLASEPAVRGPTPKQYRASRRRKDMYQSDPMLSPSLSMTSVLDTPGAGRYGLLAQTIHEEDSDF
jgi:hypothetical protein